MKQKPNTDAEDILSELENSEKNEYVEPTPTEERKTRDTILIGKKPIITYVNSTLTQLSSLPLVTITARGKSITNAVDLSQFILKRMNSVGYEISDVRISSDLLVSNDGKKRNVSSLEIDISLHLGSLIAIIFYFRKDLIGILKNKDLSLLIILGSIPLIVVGFILHKTGLINYLRNIEVVAWTTLMFGILLFFW